MLKLKYLRKKYKVSQQKLADYIGVTQATLSGWENEKYKIDNVSLQNLADFFHVTTDYLLGRTENPPENLPGAEEIKGILEEQIKDFTAEEYRELLNFVQFIRSKREK